MDGEAIPRMKDGILKPSLRGSLYPCGLRVVPLIIFNFLAQK